MKVVDAMVDCLVNMERPIFPINQILLERGSKWKEFTPQRACNFLRVDFYSKDIGTVFITNTVVHLLPDTKSYEQSWIFSR